MSDGFVHTTSALGTVVSVRIVGSSEGLGTIDEQRTLAERAVGWFHHVERCCSRFDERSELRRLCAQVERPIPVSALLFEAVQFAVAVAEETGGAFDPAIGQAMEQRGFDLDFRTGVRAASVVGPDVATYRDVRLDSSTRCITLAKALVLDLGAVAKGLAVDMAARELTEVTNFAIDAGGDLYLGGCNERGAPWRVGIRHPRRTDDLLDVVQVSNLAVCTSGDYERRGQSGHHIIDARSGEAANTAVSVTVLSSSAMVADALATAAVVLGPEEGVRLLARHGTEGVIVTSSLERVETEGMAAHYAREQQAAIVAG